MKFGVSLMHFAGDDPSGLAIELLGEMDSEYRSAYRMQSDGNALLPRNLLHKGHFYVLSVA